VKKRKEFMTHILSNLEFGPKQNILSELTKEKITEPREASSILYYTSGTFAFSRIENS